MTTADGAATAPPEADRKIPANRWFRQWLSRGLFHRVRQAIDRRCDRQALLGLDARILADLGLGPDDLDSL